MAAYVHLLQGPTPSDTLGRSMGVLSVVCGGFRLCVFGQGQMLLQRTRGEDGYGRY